MSVDEDLDERLYRELFDYEKAARNQALRFKADSSEEARNAIYDSDGQLRYWALLYIETIALFQPGPQDFERRSYQSEILKYCGPCGRSELRETFPKARDSAWRILVGMVEKDLTGLDDPEQYTIPEKLPYLTARLFHLKFPLDDMDERGPSILVSAFEKGDVAFLERLKSLAGPDLRWKSLIRIAILSLWVHPDFPLWLMSAPVATELLIQFLKESDLGNIVTQKNFENTKARLRQEGLASVSSPVITGMKFRTDGENQDFDGYEFRGDFSEFLPQLPHPNLRHLHF